MGNKHYREAYEEAAGELESILRHEIKKEERVLSLRQTMNVLSKLLQQEGENVDEQQFAKLEEMLQKSLTHDIRRIVYYSSGPMTTSDVKRELDQLGSMLEHKNPLATINAVLARLEEQGKVTETVKDGRKAWERKLTNVGATGDSPSMTHSKSALEQQPGMNVGSPSADSEDSRNSKEKKRKRKSK